MFKQLRGSNNRNDRFLPRWLLTSPSFSPPCFALASIELVRCAAPAGWQTRGHTQQLKACKLINTVKQIYRTLTEEKKKKKTRTQKVQEAQHVSAF